MGAEEQVLDMLFPPRMREWFLVQETKVVNGEVTILLEEKAVPPPCNEPLEAHGFLPVKEVRDFPIRGKPCTLLLKRRRWLVKGSTRCVSNEYTIEQQGTKLTRGFAFF
jgi:hypothetical protein